VRLRPGSAARSYPHGVDLSGLIFVALAVGWACILIPMAVKRSDDAAMNRPVDTYSDSARVVGASTPKRTAEASVVAAAPQEEAPVAIPAAPCPRTVLDRCDSVATDLALCQGPGQTGTSRRLWAAFSGIFDATL